MKRNIRKPLLVVLALVLVSVASVMGTLAYLKASTTPVINTFVSAALTTSNLTLDESEAISQGSGVYTLDTSSRKQANNYSLVPGVNVPKDPQISYDQIDVDAYLFVKATDGTDANITWTIDDTEGWTLVTGTTNVWYKAVDATNTAGTVGIIKDDIVNVGKDYASTTTETLEFQAYLIQRAGFADVAAAWAEAQNP